jgi:CheY-like chemotaxis protein
MPEDIPAQPIEVLLVEDDPGDVLMTQEAFKDYKIANRLSVVTNGEDAIAYLRKLGRFADVATPDLVLLDLNLPRRDGREVLREVKTDPELRRIPVVVLTTSDAEQDVLASYDLHANAYVRKPVDFEQFVAAVRGIDDFFITVVRLPTRDGSDR